MLSSGTMKIGRRSFLKQTGVAAAGAMSVGTLASAAQASPQQAKPGAPTPDVRDAGMQMCEAYFYGRDEQKMAFCRQMDVLGAVSGIDRTASGNQWEYEQILQTQKAYQQSGLQLRVIEGPPSLGEKTKLGLEGRDEEIANFIVFMKGLSKVGIDTIC